MNIVVSENNAKIDDDIIEIVSRVLKINKRYLGVEKNISEFNLSSLAIIEIVQSINKLYRINVSPANIYGHKTISSFIDFLMKAYSCEIMYYYNSMSIQNSLENHLRETFQGKLNESKISRKHLILLSAKNNEILNGYIKKLLFFLEGNLENTELITDLEYFSAYKTHEREKKLAIIAEDLNELFQKLTDFIQVKKNIPNVYYSENKEDLNQIKIFLLSPDAKQLLFKWINNNECEKLALLWLNGIPMEWDDVFNQHEYSISQEVKKILEQCFYTDMY